MVTTRYGNRLILVGVIQLLLSIMMMLAVHLQPLEYSTWVRVNIQSIALWGLFASSGILLMQIGLEMRNGHFQITETTRVFKVAVKTAVAFSVISVLALLVYTVFLFG